MPHIDGNDDGVGYGVSGKSSSGNGVYGVCDDGNGVYAVSSSSWGVVGVGDILGGLVGQSSSGNGVYGVSQGNGTGLYGVSRGGYAAILNGKVKITGNLEKAGGSFKIDHPLDPANKYLCHSFVESPDMKNVYDGVVVLDGKGEAEIKLPDWFGILNKDFRYQITAIGAPGPNLYIAEEILDTITTSTKYDGSHHDNDGYDDSGDNNSNNRSHFKIAGGTSDMKVSWQVTGIRKDPWASAHRIQVEEDKTDKERGYYIHPDLYGQPAENGISRLLSRKNRREKTRVAHK